MQIRGGIFDIDGVLLDTPHEQAWRMALDQLMSGSWQALRPQTTYVPGSFTSAVYQEYVAGKPRDAGAQAVLAFYHVPDPDGSRAREYAQMKQSILMRLARQNDFHAYDDALRFLLKVKASGVRICAASSSENADMFLREIAISAWLRAQNLSYPFVTPTTTLLDLFDADVDGWHVAHGKPNPDLYLTAAKQLGYPPAQCFVVEDAPAGIEAAKAGGMFGIGVARHHDEELLRAAHADIVTPTLDAVDPATLLGD